MTIRRIISIRRPGEFMLGFLLLLLLSPGFEETAQAIGLNDSIDLELDSPSFFIAGAEKKDRVGTVMASGDLDGDGFDDLAIGAPHADGPLGGQDRNGMLYIVFGPLSETTEALELGFIDELPPQDVTRLVGEDQEDWLGFSLAVGDLNGDTVDDLTVGVPLADGVDNDTDWQGEIRIFHGGPQLRSARSIEPASADQTIYGEDFFDRIGIGLTIGDLTGDARNELVIEAPFGEENRGDLSERVYVVFSSTLRSAKELPSITEALIIDHIDYERYSTGNNNNMAIGDVNGDGVGDLLIGAARGDAFSGRGRGGIVYGLFGGAHLESATSPLDFSIRDNFDLLFVSHDSSDQFGFSVAISEAGVNPGNPSIAVGAPLAESDIEREVNSGVVYLVTGGAWLETGMDLIMPASHTIEIVGEDDRHEIGQSLQFTDIDGDGRADLLLGAPLAEGPPRDDDREKGRLYCLLDETLASATDIVFLRDDFDLVIYGEEESDQFGLSVAAGNFFGNGQGTDFASSAWWGDGVESRERGDSGEIYLFKRFGAGCPCASTTADPNQDGIVDYRDAFLMGLPECRGLSADSGILSSRNRDNVLILLEGWRKR